MKKFDNCTLRNSRAWCKVTRRSDKSFTLAIGYTGEVVAFDQVTYTKEFMPTIKDAKAHAAQILEDYR